MAAELVPLSTECMCVEKNPDRQRPIFVHLCPGSVLPAFIICSYHQRLTVAQPVLPSVSYCRRGGSLIWFLMVWRDGGEGGGQGEGLGPAAAAGWLHGGGPQQGSTVPRFHKTEYKQVACHILSVRSCMTSEASVYKI